MRNSLPKIAGAVGIAALLALGAAAPAHADPWDGNDFDFGLGDWELSGSNFYLDDVYLILPDTSTEYTDIWDGMGEQAISAVGNGLVQESLECSPDDTIDITEDVETGDLLITCLASNAALVTANASIVMEIRIYAASDLIRVSSKIINEGTEDLIVDSFEFYTDFGTSGQLWGYQGQDDAILPVPADENDASRDALNGAGAQWAVHFEEDDAPGGLAWGSADAAAPATLTYLDGDEYEATVGMFTVPVGESRTVAYFALWNPATLIELGYTNSSGNGQVEAADALVPLMDEFNSVSGRLIAGFADDTVVNWVVEAAPVVPPVVPPAPQLAATGSDTSAAGVAALALLTIGAGAVAFAIRRRTADAR